ncbi:hypothetical protein [Candidatus Burkholderia verschuerenii]|uniref:hypothetical protein n=1 Tax=Candidatus Burkholderia verschuerenii TaxID=242163 RepID=UPI0018DBB3AF|nr:hypothetical protein [Candidatus Burkholderia verschuerenii]
MIIPERWFEILALSTSKLNQTRYRKPERLLRRADRYLGAQAVRVIGAVIRIVSGLSRFASKAAIFRHDEFQRPMIELALFRKPNDGIELLACAAKRRASLRALIIFMCGHGNPSLGPSPTRTARHTA